MQTKFAFDYRSSETVAALAAVRWRFYPLWVRVVVTIGVAGPMLLGMVGGVAAAVMLKQDDSAIPFGIAGILIGSFVSRPLGAALNRWSARRVHSVKAREGMTISWEVEESGLRIFTRDSEIIQRWSGIDHVFEKDGTLYLVIGMSAYLLPERAFPSPAARAAVTAKISRMDHAGSAGEEPDR